MSTISSRPTFDAIVAAAVEVTAATVGWLLVLDGEDFVVAAAAGGAAPGTRVGQRVPVAGTAGYSLASGEPTAIDSPPGDRSNVGAGGLDGNPAGVLVAPCGDEEILGVLEVARPEGSAPFTIDDIEEVTVLARVAGAALMEFESSTAATPDPAHLAAELHRLSASDPARYFAVSRAIEAILGQG